MATYFSSDPLAKMWTAAFWYTSSEQVWFLLGVKNIVFGNMNIFNTQGAEHPKEFQKSIKRGKAYSYFSLLGSRWIGDSKYVEESQKERK